MKFAWAKQQTIKTTEYEIKTNYEMLSCWFYDALFSLHLIRLKLACYAYESVMLCHAMPRDAMVYISNYFNWVNRMHCVQMNQHIYEILNVKFSL